MGTDACSDSFAFFSSSPLVVQQHPAHRLLVVISVRRECCSWRCSSSARVTYFTAPTSTTIKPARAGVDFVEARGAVLFEVGQQRAQLAVEVLPALADDWKESEDSQRAFAVVLEAPADTSTLLRASTEIIVEPTSTSVPAAAPTTSASYTVVGILAAAGLAVLLVCWYRAWRCRLPRRSRAFQYKVLLLPRRNSGASEDIRNTSVSPRGSPVKKSGIRRSARRVSSFKNWRAVLERQRQEAPDHVVPEDEVEKVAVDEQDKVKGSSEDAEDDSEPEKDLREHLASIQSAGGR
ncbi:hypothetical protein PF005_g3306 [Phytophthora fragariae]|uniref:Calx-beta domain-containing protein n=1 Tax=Phytophthora fragariae TaxID=53985 RepID=A0A6A3Z673_9STRA|nr:hypothetical protein PF003_g39224 [Phytophthora fragariae]KAE8946246.1 hypothetical protein PF009_g4125 [Phytophthora fragariae]KAE9017788.1 hypothetical protein PF011_g6541 [Phytophthora fragariae]KAE9098255.1 hypothetical protein PF010_g15636 [Phytophthora fragariae]KAE9131991.1 hypothetical protein PF007_g3886 [Phytophthora fragariae]